MLIRFVNVILPRPVTGSQPVEQLNPALQQVMAEA